MKGELHSGNGTALIQQSKLEFASDESNSNVGVVFVVVPVGPESIVVCGSVPSTMKVRLAGDGSGLPAASIARTSNVWLPSSSCAEV